jgi:zinc transport system substrate-binding protein
MWRKTFRCLPILLVLCFTALSCQGGDTGSAPGRIVVVTTLFPLYDFAKNVAGGRADVSLLLPPGVEPHGFEPRPADIFRLNSADLFIYTGPDMEPWALDLIRGVQNRKLEVIQAGSGILPEGNRPADIHRHEHREPAASGGRDAVDPHIWLDFAMAAKMVETIRDGFIRKDEAGREIYEKNASEYTERLKTLDDRYRKGLQSCEKKLIVNGGHFAFAYMAKRYGFRYLSVYGVSPDAEPTAANLAGLTKILRDNGLRYLFYEELLNPNVARMLSNETGAVLLKLQPAHNLTKEQFDRKDTFLSLMEQNLENLRTGMQCR